MSETPSNPSPIKVIERAEDGLSTPLGFSFSATNAGIKRSRTDLGVIVSDAPCTVAGCFTRNPVRAACVERNQALLPRSDVRGLVVNSGNANAMTGAPGKAADAGMAIDLATLLECTPEQVLTGSTGMIGIPLDRRLVTKALPKALGGLSADPMPFAEAIVTTDTCSKIANVVITLPSSGVEVRLFGAAKGSGMIHPNMATTLGYVVTDAGIDAERLQTLVRRHVDDTFNAICVDGDTSTNDTVLVLANGKAGPAIAHEADLAAFSAALGAVLRSLAIQVARDGEGATRLLTVHVRGAENRKQAQSMARAICRGSLFKCAVFAGQANYGRVAAAAGQAALQEGFSLDPDKLTISAQGVTMLENGLRCEEIKTSDVEKLLREPEVTWTLKVGDGPGEFTAYGCDLSYDYVRINADEVQQIEVSPTGRVIRNLTLAAYSPRLKHQLLVEGLAYVRRFVGLKTMVYVYGTALRRHDLAASLAQDLELCLDAGMRPLLVIPDPEIARNVEEHMKTTGHYVADASGDPTQTIMLLDRGNLCVLKSARPDPGEMVDLALKIGIGKLVAIGDDHGLSDGTGLVSQLSPELLLQGLERNRFGTANPEVLALCRHAARRGVPAVHVIDGRMPHALVGELFTNQGIGTLITRQAVV